MAGSPQIDIIVPAMTSADELDVCLAKLTQFIPEMMPINWIIVDDACKDQVLEVARFFAHSRHSATIIRNEKKLYLAHSVNRAMDYAKTKFRIVCMTGVQVEDKGFLEKILYPFIRDPRAVVSVADCRCDWNSLAPWRITSNEFDLHPDLWAVTKDWVRLKEGEIMDSSVRADLSFDSMIRSAKKIANPWVVPSVRTIASPYQWPSRLPTTEDLSRRARSSPTVVMNK